VALALSAAGCASERDNPAGAEFGPVVPHACPAPLQPNGEGMIAIVDYADFVRFDGRDYYLRPRKSGTSEVPLEESIGTVVCRLAGKEPEGYRIQNGDAPCLSPGTPIFAIDGEPVHERIAVQLDDGRVLTYKAE